jgi:hypothetical protein
VARASAWCKRTQRRELKSSEMATRGRKPTATVLRLITGNPGHRPIARDEPRPTGALERPAKLSKTVGRLWDTWIARCFWLTWADSPKALMWCHLQAEFERSPKNMTASRIGQLRALGSELGLDPGSRARLGTKGGTGAKPETKDKAAKYLT